jgi:hypothetical protein
MPRPVVKFADRKIPCPVAITTKHIDFISSFPRGKNFSEKLREILNTFMDENQDIVRFELAEIERGIYDPVYAKTGAFLVYQCTIDTKEIGHDLPVKITAKMPIDEMVKQFINLGYKCQVVEDASVGFISVWASPKGDHCKRCIAKVRESHEKIQREMNNNAGQ